MKQQMETSHKQLVSQIQQLSAQKAKCKEELTKNRDKWEKRWQEEDIYRQKSDQATREILSSVQQLSAEVSHSRTHDQGVRGGTGTKQSSTPTRGYKPYAQRKHFNS
jgi:trehalose/maltose hydrolase-like predicted phosphorylase